jgi:hypothetical protein
VPPKKCKNSILSFKFHNHNTNLKAKNYPNPKNPNLVNYKSAQFPGTLSILCCHQASLQIRRTRVVQNNALGSPSLMQLFTRQIGERSLLCQFWVICLGGFRCWLLRVRLITSRDYFSVTRQTPPIDGLSDPTMELMCSLSGVNDKAYPRMPLGPNQNILCPNIILLVNVSWVRQSVVAVTDDKC